MKTAWHSIEPAIIFKSFKKCSISNDLDGTEDDELWDEHLVAFFIEVGVRFVVIYDDHMLTHEQIQQMFNEDSDDEVLGFQYIC